MIKYVSILNRFLTTFYVFLEKDTHVKLFYYEFWRTGEKPLTRTCIQLLFECIYVKSRKYQGVFEMKSRVKTWQVRGIWSQQLEH